MSKVGPFGDPQAWEDGCHADACAEPSSSGEAVAEPSREETFLLTCPWCGIETKGRPMSFTVPHLISHGDDSRARVQALEQEIEARETYCGECGQPGECACIGNFKERAEAAEALVKALEAAHAGAMALHEADAKQWIEQRKALEARLERADADHTATFTTWRNAADHAAAERDEARRFAEDAANRYNALLAETRILRCAFCGAEYPDGTPATQHEALTAHVLICPVHPMRKAEQQATALRESLRFARDAIFAASPDDAFGIGYAGEESWPLKAEILTKLDSVLAEANPPEEIGRALLQADPLKKVPRG
jgi:hypothetical protein